MLFLGVASGNTATFMFVLGLILAPLVYWILHQLQYIEENHPEYELQEINDVSAALSIALMRIRDGKNKGINPDGTLSSLVKEMKRLCELEEIQKQKENTNKDSVITKSIINNTTNNLEKIENYDEDDNEDINRIESVVISFQIEQSNCDDMLPNERLLSNQRLMIFNT